MANKRLTEAQNIWLNGIVPLNESYTQEQCEETISYLDNLAIKMNDFIHKNFDQSIINGSYTYSVRYIALYSSFEYYIEVSNDLDKSDLISELNKIDRFAQSIGLIKSKSFKSEKSYSHKNMNKLFLYKIKPDIVKKLKSDFDNKAKDVIRSNWNNTLKQIRELHNLFIDDISIDEQKEIIVGIFTDNIFNNGDLDSTFSNINNIKSDISKLKDIIRKNKFEKDIVSDYENLHKDEDYVPLVKISMI